MKGSKIQSEIIRTIKLYGNGIIFKCETPSIDGMPDIQFLWGGRTLFLEVKGENDTLKMHQKLCHKDLRDLQFHVYVIKSIDEGLEIIAKFQSGCCMDYGEYYQTEEK